MLKVDPTKTLLSSENETLEYFVKRDLIEEKVVPIKYIWHQPEVRKIFRRQQPDGTWKYSGKKTAIFPKYHHSMAETWKTYWLLVERYELNKQHEGARKASEFLFSCQTKLGDFRGMLANQYATYYTGAILALLIKSGYPDDPRVKKGFNWLLSMRQDDGGWTIPILTHAYDKKIIYNLTSKYAEPIEPDRSKPFSHNWTDMVLRAFALHPEWRHSEEAKKAAILLKNSIFQPDFYSSYKDARYWTTFYFWWPNLVTTLEILSLIGFSKEDPDVKRALNWLAENQSLDGLWNLSYNENEKKQSNIEPNVKTNEKRLWLTLKIARTIKRFYQ